MQYNAPRNEQIDMWIMANSKFLPAENIPYLHERLSHLQDGQLHSLYSLRLKDPTHILLFSIFLGGYGVDRFILGDIGLGLGKLFTAGGCGIWWFVDIFLVMGKTREVNFGEVMKLLAYYGL